jgi:ferrous iron transport protein B
VASHSLGAAALDQTGLGLGDLVADSVFSRRGAASLQISAGLESVRWRLAQDWAAQVDRRRDVPVRLADRIAVWSTSPWPGLPIFVAVTAAAFGAMMWIGGTLSTILTGAWTAAVSPGLTSAVHTLVPQPVLAAGLLWGLDGGILALLSVGIPYILTFYVLLAALEDSGYLTSAAVLTDRLFNTLGLPGRAAIPLLAASGCNVPAIYGTRVLPSRRERLLAAFLVTMTPCSARSAVVVAAVAPFAGPIAALGAFGLIAVITFASGLAANAMVPGRQPALVLELSPIRRPILRHVARKAWLRFADFVRTAAPLMLGGSVILGLLYESGLVWHITVVLDPVVKGWLGLPSVAGLALVFAFLRKELALQLLVALAVVQLGAQAANLGSIMTPAQLFVYAVVTSVSVPCVATLAALKGEFGWRPALTMSGATLAIAIGAGGILARLLGTA